MEIKGSVVSIKGINVQTSNIPILSPSVTNGEVDGIPNINISAEDGKDGVDGKSAYQQAVEGGYTGTEQEFNCSLSLLADVAEGKKQIADAINTKGGNSTPDESFQQLAEDIQTLPYAGISAEGIVQTEEFSFLEYITSKIYPFTEINSEQITSISKNYIFQNNILLKKVQFSNLIEILGSYVFSECISLKDVIAPKLIRITGSNIFLNCKNLVSIQLEQLTNIEANSCFEGCTSLQIVNFPKLEYVSGIRTLTHCDSLTNLVVGVLTRESSLLSSTKNKLRNITIGLNTNINLSFSSWSAIDVIAEGQSGIDELNSNLYNNLLTKLYDHSGDGETRTLKLGWLAYVTQENIDYANSKGWTLTT